MGRRRGEAQRIKPGSKPTKLTLYTDDEADSREETGAVGGVIAIDGELPIFSSPKISRSRPVNQLQDETSKLKRETSKLKRETSDHKRESSKGGSAGGGGHGRSDVGEDVQLGVQDESGWPLGNQEIASWTSSFRFDLDSGRFQSILPTPGGSFRSSPGGSFRFRNGAEEISVAALPQGSLLKPPRQMEKPIHHDSQADTPQRFAAGDGPVYSLSHGARVLPIEPHKNVAVDVPDSPERTVILQRLRDLQSAAASPRFGLEIDASYHKELAKLTIGRDDGLNQWLKSSSPLWKGTNAKAAPTQESPRDVAAVIAAVRRKQSSHSPSLVGESGLTPVRASGTPATSRFNLNSGNNNSLHEQILCISKQSPQVSSPPPDHTHFLPAAIPFQWEDQPGKPKSIRVSRRLSREDAEILKYVDRLPFAEVVKVTDTYRAGLGDGDDTRTESHRYGSSRMGNDDGIKVRMESPRYGGNRMGHGDGIEVRTESHRYYGKVQHSREASLGQSSRRYSLNEKLIDLDASAAAKFLVEQFDTPLSTPERQSSSSPSFAVPFKWEDTPGRAKVGRDKVGRPNMLQLPPRLAVPSHQSTESFGRASHPFSGFFAPCLTASSPGRKPTLASCKSLPPRAPSPPEQRRKRHGLVGRCSSLPQEGCQIIVSRSTASSPVLKPAGRDLASSPTSILTGPDGSSSQTSASNCVFSSGDLDDFTQQTSQSSSYASIEEDFVEGQNLASSNSGPPPKSDLHKARVHGASTPISSRNADPATSTLLGASPASRNGDSASSILRGASTASRDGDLASSAVRGVSAASQNGDPASSTLRRDPSASASPNCKLAIRTSTLRGGPSASASPTYKLPTPTSPMFRAPPSPVSSEVQASPKRPTRLPYTMPSMAEQVLSSCGETARRQLIQDLSPRLLRQYSGRRLTRSYHTPISRTERSSTTNQSPAHAAEGGSSPSPAYAAALELLSPAVNLISRRRKGRSPARSSLVKPRRRRPRFMLSIGRALKRVLLGKRQHSKSVEPKLMMYCDTLAPPSFEFSKPN